MSSQERPSKARSDCCEPVTELSRQKHGPLIQWVRAQGLRAPGGPELLRCNFYCGIINKTVQIPMMGLSVLS